MTSNGNQRIAIVEELRGLAALAVVWFHFTNGNPNFLEDGALKASGTFGWVGVEVFFVVSAFIIPFTLYKRGYTTSEHYPRFLAKRLLRLEPPYLACVALTVLLGYWSSALPGFRGVAPSYTPVQVFLHIGYLVGFSNYEWVNLLGNT
jgi:peptidoglycan/LPS O-acetylase OafA/YrhL